MAVHHVDMDPVGAGRFDRADLLAELGEVGRQDRGRDDQRAHFWPPDAVRLTRWRPRGNAPAHGLLTRQSARGGRQILPVKLRGLPGRWPAAPVKQGFSVCRRLARVLRHTCRVRPSPDDRWTRSCGVSNHVHVSRRNVQCANLFPAFPKPVGGRQRRIGRYRPADRAAASDVVHIHFQPGEPGRRRGQLAAARRQQQRRALQFGQHGFIAVRPGRPEGRWRASSARGIRCWRWRQRRRRDSAPAIPQPTPTAPPRSPPRIRTVRSPRPPHFRTERLRRRPAPRRRRRQLPAARDKAAAPAVRATPISSPRCSRRDCRRWRLPPPCWPSSSPARKLRMAAAAFGWRRLRWGCGNPAIILR